MKILVIRMDVLGDAIVSGTFLDSLKQSIHNSTIDVLCHHTNYYAFNFHPSISTIYKINHQQASKLLASDFDSVVVQINAVCTYDLVIVLNRCARSFRYALQVKSRKIIVRQLITKSFRSKMLLFKMKFSHKVLFFAEKFEEHEVICLNAYCKFILNYLKINAKVVLPTIAKFYLADNFERNSFIEHSIVINASGKKNESRFMNDGLLYALFCELTKSNYKLAVVVTDDDVSRVQTVIQSVNFSIELICSFDLFSLAHAIAKYEFYIGVDGGLTHIAAGLGLKCVALFDRQDQKIWHPWTLTQISLQSERKNIYDISYQEVVGSIKAQS